MRYSQLVVIYKHGKDVNITVRVIEQPFKIPFVAAIILVANSKNEEVGKQIVEEFRSHAQGYLDECQWRPFKLILRFLACLSSLFSDDGIMILLDDIANFAGEVASGDSSNVRLMNSGAPCQMCIWGFTDRF